MGLSKLVGPADGRTPVYRLPVALWRVPLTILECGWIITPAHPCPAHSTKQPGQVDLRPSSTVYSYPKAVYARSIQDLSPRSRSKNQNQKRLTMLCKPWVSHAAFLKSQCTNAPMQKPVSSSTEPNAGSYARSKPFFVPSSSSRTHSTCRSQNKKVTYTTPPQTPHECLQTPPWASAQHRRRHTAASAVSHTARPRSPTVSTSGGKLVVVYYPSTVSVCS